MSLSLAAVLLRWADGRLFLIDTGMDRQGAVAFGEPIKLLMGAGDVQTFGPVQEQMGDGIQAIRGIGFTHLHIDHTSGITDVCSVLREPAVIYQTRQQTTLQNLHTEQGQQLVEASACRHRMLGDETMAPVPGFPGLVAIAAGGHTPGSTLFVTRVDGETWVFSGDLTNSLAEIVENRSKGWLYSYLLVPENVAQLARWRPWLRSLIDSGTHVVVAHDLATYRDNGLLPWTGTP